MRKLIVASVIGLSVLGLTASVAPQASATVWCHPVRPGGVC
jgi:hypothetical protein